MSAAPAQTPLGGPARAPGRAGWFFVLFALPFVAIGLDLIATAVRGLLGENPGSDEVMQVACGFVFSAMGSMAMFLGFREVRSGQERATRQARHPDEPWRWRSDWDSRRVRSADRSAALGLLAFAGIWNAFCVPMLWAVPASDAPFVWLFVIVGMGFAVAAALATWRWLRFGRSVLEIAALPGRPGGRLRGAIQLQGAARPPNGFRATLSCVRFTSGRNSQEHILWQEEGVIPAAAVRLGPIGTQIPVDFPIPADAEPSSVPGQTSGICWRVAIFADVPGLDLASTFEVPVFHSGAPQLRTREATSDPVGALGPVLQPEAPMALDRERYTPNSPNRLLRRGASAVEVRLPAARNKAQAAFFTAFTVVWSFIAALAWFAAPLVFGVLFVAAWLLVAACSITLWLRSWRLVADLSGVAVTSRILGVGWTRRVPANAIQKIAPKIVGEGGKRAYYDLRIHRTGGRPVKAGDGIRSKREAEWLCAALWRAVHGGSDDAAPTGASGGR